MLTWCLTVCILHMLLVSRQAKICVVVDVREGGAPFKRSSSPNRQLEVGRGGREENNEIFGLEEGFPVA